ncbi:MAG TPA: tRNA lysidine(34) synthetase TilS [Dehalococcoidia bacterium]|nr:tRNA lysidine(34) synthetase TilS [Dehalococcoidia bacterium]
MVKKEKTLEQRVIHFIQEHKLFSAGEKLVVAVSGGADSVCLFHILVQWQRELGVKLQVAHLNHQLRGAESDSDAKYVCDLAHHLDIPVTIEHRDVAAYRDRKGYSLEEAAREVRYSFLAEVAGATGASRVTVGHTRDDQIETILMHLLRGTGIAGLRGLQPRSLLQYGEDRERMEVVRPLLEVTRQETLDYCQRYQLRPRSDSSNTELSFLRNRVRLELLPVLRNYNPSIDKALLRLAAAAGDDVSFIEEQALWLWNKVAKEESSAIYLDRSKIASLPRAMQRQILRLAVARLLGSLKDIEADHLEAMVDFLAKPAGKRLCLPQGLTLLTEYGRLVLTSAQASLCPLPPLEDVFNINVPGKTALPSWQVKADILKEPGDSDEDSFAANFDLDKVGKELTVRQRKPGDRFQPLGMSQIKKLQDFMVDVRIPRTWRGRVPLVCSGEQILWVVGWRIDDRVKVTEATKNILRLEFERLV